jgi:hypothetical protein
MSDQVTQQEAESALSAGVDFNVYSVPYKISITGDYTVKPGSGALTLDGSASLSEPLSLQVKNLSATFRTKGDFWIRIPVPADSLANLVSQSANKLGGDTKSVINATVIPYLNAYQDPVLVISTLPAESKGEDQYLKSRFPALGGYFYPGVNFLANVSPASVEPFKTLIDSFGKALSASLPPIETLIAAKTGSSPEVMIKAGVELDVTLGTKALTLQSAWVALAVAGGEATLSLDLTFSLKLDNEELILDGGLQTATPVDIWGRLSAADGKWENPFGVPDLTISDLAMQVGPQAEPPYASVGVEAGFALGNPSSPVLDGKVTVNADPENPILQLVSQKGINLPQLLTTLVDSSIGAAKVVDFSLTNINLYFAPKDVWFANVKYLAGWTIKGDLDAWGWNAAVDGSVTYTKGGYLKGAMDRVDIKAGSVTFLEISNTDKSGGANLDIELTDTRQSAQIDGLISLLDGAFSQSLKADISTKGFSVTFQESGMGIYGGSSLILDSSTFKVDVTTGVDFSVTVAGQTINTQADAALSVSAGKSSFSQSLSFALDFLGKSTTLKVTSSLPTPFKDVDELRQELMKQERDLVKFLSQTLTGVGEPAYTWVKGNVTQAADVATKLFQDLGVSNPIVAKNISKVYNVSAENAVSYLGVGASEAATILNQTFGRPIKEVSSYLQKTYNLKDEALSSTLKAGGFAADAVSKFMKDVFNWPPKIPHVDHIDTHTDKWGFSKHVDQNL